MAASPLALARELRIDARELRATVERLAAISSDELGFRTAGTPEDREAAEYVAGELRAIGLEGVAIEDVRVDAWRFEGAALEAGDRRVVASSMGGVPGAELEARLVDAGDGQRLDRLDLAGAIALVDWRREDLWLSDVALELGLRGVAGVVANCPPGADFFQSDGALGAFDGAW